MADDTIRKSDEEWRRQLGAERFGVTRRRGTEPPFTGAHWNSKTPGIYRCVCCGAELFRSETKFDSGSGWPSFGQPVVAEAICTTSDDGHGMRRTEVRCRRCDAHLGHVFPDGPPPTGLRYCVNSASLALDPDDDEGRSGG